MAGEDGEGEGKEGEGEGEDGEGEDGEGGDGEGGRRGGGGWGFGAQEGGDEGFDLGWVDGDDALAAVVLGADAGDGDGGELDVAARQAACLSRERRQVEVLVHHDRLVHRVQQAGQPAPGRRASR